MSNVFPQGSILSVTCFALKINSIVKSLSPGVECSLHVDDFRICYRSKFVHIIERHLQRSLNNLQHWVDSNGFKFSSTKTVCVHFCRLRKAHPDPQLLLIGTPIPVVEQTKFIGLIFDKKLSFITHLQYLKNKCLKTLNLLRVAANTKWASDEKTLLHLYRSLIRSKLEYGAVVYGSARKSACWTLSKTKLYIHVWVLSGHPLSQAYMSKRMKCLSIWDAQCFRQNTVWVNSNAYNPVRSCISCISSQFTKFFNKNPNSPYSLLGSLFLVTSLGLPRKII